MLRTCRWIGCIGSAITRECALDVIYAEIFIIRPGSALEVFDGISCHSDVDVAALVAGSAGYGIDCERGSANTVADICVIVVNSC